MELLYRGETIVAPATPPGRSALAVVRLSGPHCRSIAAELFGCSQFKPRTMTLARWRSPQGESIDELLIVLFPAPHSFTGEDLLEIYPHGNPLLVSRLLRELSMRDGCRLAKRGEFTRRAYENGRLDLAQAEAVGATIHARTPEALQLAQRLAEGKLSARITELTDALIHLSAQVELEMDFAEEEASPEMERWPQTIAQLRQIIAKLLEGWEQAQRASITPKVVLCGPPNAGKSSLANALLDEERLLVSDRPGTTRDWVEAALVLPAGELALCDTAGLGTAQDDLDQEAQQRTLALLSQADLAIWVEDGRETSRSIEVPPHLPTLRVRTRVDLPQFIEEKGTLSVGCRTGEGIQELRHTLDQHLRSRVALDEETVVATERQAEALRRGALFLQEAAELLERGGRTTPEMVSHTLRDARNALATITGEITTDLLLQQIFSSFCIGK